MTATFDIDAVGTLTSLKNALATANTVFVEDEIVYAADATTYVAQHQNWLLVPQPPQVRVNGDLQAASTYTLTTATGTVAFHTPVQATDIVTVSYWWAFFGDDELTDFLHDALAAVEGSIGAAGTLIDTALPRMLKAPILGTAHVYALRGLLSSNLDNYLWKVEGRTVDKRTVATAFLNAIKALSEQVQTDLAWIRPQWLAEGETVVLNLDMNQPPTRFSQFDAQSVP